MLGDHLTHGQGNDHEPAKDRRAYELDDHSLSLAEAGGHRAGAEPPKGTNQNGRVQCEDGVRQPLDLGVRPLVVNTPADVLNDVEEGADPRNDGENGSHEHVRQERPWFLNGCDVRRAVELDRRRSVVVARGRHRHSGSSQEAGKCVKHRFELAWLCLFEKARVGRKQEKNTQNRRKHTHAQSHGMHGSQDSVPHSSSRSCGRASKLHLSAVQRNYCKGIGIPPKREKKKKDRAEKTKKTQQNRTDQKKKQEQNERNRTETETETDGEREKERKSRENEERQSKTEQTEGPTTKEPNKRGRERKGQAEGAGD